MRFSGKISKFSKTLELWKICLLAWLFGTRKQKVKIFLRFLNIHNQSDFPRFTPYQLSVHLKRSKKREAKLRVKNISYFNFWHEASLRSAIFSDIQVNNNLVTFPARVKLIAYLVYFCLRFQFEKLYGQTGRIYYHGYVSTLELTQTIFLTPPKIPSRYKTPEYLGDRR